MKVIGREVFVNWILVIVRGMVRRRKCLSIEVQLCCLESDVSCGGESSGVM